MGKTYKDRRDYHEKGGKRAFKGRNPYAHELQNPRYRPRRMEDKRDSMINTLDKDYMNDEGEELSETVPVGTRTQNIPD